MPNYTPPSSEEELKAECLRLGVNLPYSKDYSVLISPTSVGNLVSPNRFVALPMEGCDADEDGSPSPLTLRRYNRIAEGGSGIIWIEAAAVCPEGRSNRHAFMLNKRNLERFAGLVSSIRGAAKKAGNERIVCIIQLTHAGRYSFLKKIYADNGSPISLLTGQTGDIISDDELEIIRDNFAETAALAQEAGFDGVDIKGCHGYLFSELLSSYHRPGRYGGAEYENRTRLLTETFSSVREAVPGMLLACRLNVFDGLPMGWGVKKDGSLTPDLAEPLRLAKDLADEGASTLGVTLGCPRYDAHFGRPSARLADGGEPPEHPLVGIERMVGLTSEIQKHVPQTPVAAAGLAWLGTLSVNTAAGIIADGGAALFGQGRGSFAYPDIVRQCLTGEELNAKRACIACSLCSDLMKRGGPTGCLVRDGKTYREIYNEYRKER